MGAATASTDAGLEARAPGGEGKSLRARLRQMLPQGRTIPESAWERRHHAMVALLVAEAIGLTIFSLAQGNSFVHSVGHSAGLIPIALLALYWRERRRLASVLVSIGLITACALLVHLWHGVIEAHFLFFVTIVVLALYEDWVPFLVAAAYVVIHHGLTGAIDPGAVYNHPDAVAHPWKWAVIHGLFVVGAGLASLVAWRMNESLRADSHEAFRLASENEERFRGAFEGAPIGMVLFSLEPGASSGVLQVNPAICEITGFSEAQLRADRFWNIIHPDDMPSVWEGMEGLLSGEAERLQTEIRYVHADGHTVWVNVSVSLLRGSGGTGRLGIAQVQDVTERKRAAEELAYQALHDALTGLPNRRSLFSDLEQRLHQASSEEPLLMTVFDLNGFKAYNDTFGHPAGDSLLIRMAKALDEALEEDCRAYRMGGDEFCVLSWAAPDRHDSVTAAAVEALTEHGDGFTVTPSHGSVLVPHDAKSVPTAVQRADQRMYARKSVDSRTSAGRQSADVLLTILSERSPALGVHLTEVTGLCEAVAKLLEVPDEEMGALLQGASLHDVGKAAIPDEILHKPGVLDEDEWQFIRRHTLIGERILSAAPALARAAKLVRSSHERFDGEGYPDQLAGEQIPLASRIIAVCDSFDAMISQRPYRAAMTTEEALEELRRCAGAQFDPDVVEAFCEALAERRAAEVSLPKASR